MPAEPGASGWLRYFLRTFLLTRLDVSEKIVAAVRDGKQSCDDGADWCQACRDARAGW